MALKKPGVTFIKAFTLAIETPVKEELKSIGHADIEALLETYVDNVVKNPQMIINVREI